MHTAQKFTSTPTIAHTHTHELKLFCDFHGLLCTNNGLIWRTVQYSSVGCCKRNVPCVFTSFRSFGSYVFSLSFLSSCFMPFKTSIHAIGFFWRGIVLIGFRWAHCMSVCVWHDNMTNFVNNSMGALLCNLNNLSNHVLLLFKLTGHTRFGLGFL